MFAVAKICRIALAHRAFSTKAGQRISSISLALGGGFLVKQSTERIGKRLGNYDLEVEGVSQEARVTGLGFLNWYYNCLNLNLITCL